jgi:hypothetical protein
LTIFYHRTRNDYRESKLDSSISQSDELDGSIKGGDLFEMDDGILSRKMTVVNEAMNHIGFTPYHWKLFMLNGMGYGVDSLLFML